MFYSQFILAKKGPLGTIWIAAHLERKLRKNQVADTDIGVSVDSILFPEVPIALRLSSHLLLGVVRIYSRKVGYLFDDCSEALLKVKQAFRSTAVDLPPEQSKAPYHSITLPETFDLDDFELPDNELFQGNYVDHHVSTREQITLQDTMDGVAFSTSQFGPDERFGDGDASQIGLDLDEDLFLDKGEAAGTSGILMGTDVDPQASAKDSSFKGDTHDEGVSAVPSASPSNNFSIQAPSTPGLMEEPSFPSVQEALVSDDHMDEDQHPSDLAAKEGSGTAFSQAELTDLDSNKSHINGNGHPLDEQENVKARSERVVLSNEALQLISSDSAQLRTSTEDVEADDMKSVRDALNCSSVEYEGNSKLISSDNAQILTTSNEDFEADDMNSVGDLLNRSSIENKGNMVANLQSKGHSVHDEIGLNENASNGVAMEVDGCDPFVGGEKRNVDGTYAPVYDIGLENNISSTGPEALSAEEADRIVVLSGSESQCAGQPLLNLKNRDAIETDGDENVSASKTPVLQACSSRLQDICNGVDGLIDTSNLSVADDGVCSLGVSGREDTTNVSGITTDVQDLQDPALKAGQIAYAVAYADNSSLSEKLDNLNSGEYNSAKQDNSRVSDFSAPEKLLSMPDLPAVQANNFLVECTPGEVNLADGGDASGEKLLTSRKRSYTESTLTIQSVNSAESSGAAQSKQSAEFVPDDDDLLSSILVGKRSSTLKMKPSPSVTDSLPAKRQRTAVRSSAHKRKVVVDDSMVLHGETIREQLTNTEDIRRVRKKAPCTRLEVWVLQKQFLEDEIFSEAIFTGMSPDFRCLHSQAIDLCGIRIDQDVGSKGANQTDASTRATESLGTCTPSVGKGDMEQEHGTKMIETARPQESAFAVDGSTLQKEMETFDNEVAKEKLQHAVSVENVEIESTEERAPVGREANHSVASDAELTASVCPVSELHSNSIDNNKVDSPYPNDTSDVVMSMEIDLSCQLLDQQSMRQDASAVEDVSEAGRPDQEVVDVSVPEKQDSDARTDGEFLSEKLEGLDTSDTVVVATADFQDTCSLPVDDFNVTNSVALEGSSCPTSEKVLVECQLDELGYTGKDENVASDLRHDGSSPTPDNLLGGDANLDSLYPTEADLGPQSTKLIERENSECWEADPNIVTKSAAVPTELIDPRDHVDFETEAIEHDTDFLNVDDDEVAEDYESDIPNPEEKRILDNSGWSSRTRAVANYLQVLFEKEDQSSKVVSLGSLLAGKSRKEASRMFFETLVLKTKDYIYADQDSSFCDIKIKPRGKLLKSDF